MWQPLSGKEAAVLHFQRSAAMDLRVHALGVPLVVGLRRSPPRYEQNLCRCATASAARSTPELAAVVASLFGQQSAAVGGTELMRCLCNLCQRSAATTGTAKALANTELL